MIAKRLRKSIMLLRESYSIGNTLSKRIRKFSPNTNKISETIKAKINRKVYPAQIIRVSTKFLRFVVL